MRATDTGRLLRTRLCVFACWVRLIFSLVFVIAISVSSALAEEKLVIPTFYATDRLMDTAAVDNLRFTNHQNDHLSYGLKNIVVVNPTAVSDPTNIQGLGWWNILPGAAPAGPPQPSITLSESEFFPKLNEVVKSGPENRPLIVFVHGCCTDFDGGMNNASRLANDCQAPVVLYAWCSIPPTMEKYRENETTQRNNAMLFGRFLDKLSENVSPQNIVIVAHSMGNRFLHETFKHRYWGHGMNPEYPKFSCSVFACADVNVDDFASDETGVAFNSQKTYVTKNNFDPALIMSSVQRGFYGRLGAPAFAVKKLINTDTVDLVSIEKTHKNTHVLPTPVIAALLGKIRGGVSSSVQIWQLKPHLFEAQP